MTTDTEPTTETEPDFSKLEKIRALLDKAESTAYPEEAEALTIKAIELMEKYRIDEAMIADARPAQDRGKIIAVRIKVGAGPYVNARIDLANQIAMAQSVKLVIYTGYNGKSIELNGYETDVAMTEMLYTSLLVQATRALASPEVKASKPGYVHGTAFSRSFLISFAHRIGQRLREANKTVAANHDTGDGRSVALVLADRQADVEADVLRRHGKLRSARPAARSSSQEGGWAGRDAADRADLSTNRRVNGNNQRALSA
jgi:hypothetical protein